MSQLVNWYLRDHDCDLETLFFKAYAAYFGGVIDRYEIRANLDRYKRTQDPPPYVRAFIH